MSNILKTHIVRIGNSQGIRLPKLLIEQARLGPEVEIEVGTDHLVIRTVRRPRENWDSQFAEMATHGDDALLDTDAPLTAWDDKEWEW